MKSMESIKNRYLFAAMFVLFFGGSIFYMIVERWNFLDSMFFCVATLATVGYGNMVPVTPAGKIFTIFYIIFGISVFLFFINNISRNYGEKFHNKRLNRISKSKEDSKK